MKTGGMEERHEEKLKGKLDVEGQHVSRSHCSECAHTRTQILGSSGSNGNPSSWKTSGIMSLSLNIADMGSRQVQRKKCTLTKCNGYAETCQKLLKMSGSVCKDSEMGSCSDIAGCTSAHIKTSGTRREFVDTTQTTQGQKQNEGEEGVKKAVRIASKSR
ncbi:hypothetical protein Anapl_15191 [Anas platyrhynchos]|uniref:Uncharacterized protein n=1 Tax=Anas platyrhynchos TaxID=8839 RepID=R0J9W2_ANAPL|nr:hypothetical protein Anapl_15191 [Anas platyrhynchos]